MIQDIIASLLLKNYVTVCIALVWLINGLFCKVLNLVPRHRLIVGNILGNRYAALFTKLIGIAEVLIAVWIVSNIQPVLCAVVQMVVVAVMNIIEVIKVPRLLLFGRVNILIAAFFIGVVYVNTFVWLPTINP